MLMFADPRNPWIECQSSHTLETSESYANPRTPWKPMNHMPILTHPGNPGIICQSLHTMETHQYNSSSKSLKFNSLVQSSQTLSISLFLEEFFIVIQTSSCHASFQKTTSIHWSTDPSLSTDDLNNFRLIQITTSFPECSKQPPTFNLTCPNSLFFFQSADRIFHSTETTLLKIHIDLILAMDRGEVTCILLDLFEAFDTVDHSILLDHPSSQLVRVWWYFT